MSTLNDGFGEDLSPEELVASHEGLARHIAARMQRDHAPFDDLVQEARIALWQASPKYPGHDLRGGLASTIVQRRLTEVVIRETWTGHSHKAGPQPGPKRDQVTSIEMLLEATGNTLRQIAEEEAGLDAAEWGYHHGEIFQALSGLTERQRRYVYRRFWLLDSQTEIARDEGRTKAQVQHEWQDHIRPLLEGQLLHLVTA